MENINGNFGFLKIEDCRNGLNGELSSEAYGKYSELAIKLTSGTDLREAVFIVSESRRSGKILNNPQPMKIAKETILAMDRYKIIWGCTRKCYEASPSRPGISTQKRWEAIPGFPGGHPVKIQKFLDQYQEWVEENSDLAAKWLFSLAQEEDFLDEYSVELLDRAIGSCGKEKQNSAWEEVARDLGTRVKWPYSITGIRSAPIKIAQALQNNKKETWGLRGDRAFSYKGEKPRYPGDFKKDYILIGCGYNEIGVELKQFRGDFPLVAIPHEKETVPSPTKAEAVS